MMQFSIRDDGAIAIDGLPGVGIAVCTPDIVRIRFGAAGERCSYLDERTWPPADGVSLGADTIDTGRVVLHLSTGLTIGNHAGAVRLRLALPQRERTLRLDLAGEQHFYGLGQYGGFDRLGVARRLWNSHVNHASGGDIAIPLLLSHAGYGLFFDNASEARLDTGDSDHTTWLDYACSRGALDLYFLAGDSLRDALAGAAELLGHAPMPPRWSLGYLQSTRHFDDAEELRQLPATFREKQMPCDAVILLSSYGDAMGWNRGVGTLDCHPQLLPDPAALFAAWRRQHVRVVTHEYPVVRRDAPQHVEDHLLDFAYPVTPPEARTPVSYMDGQRFVDFARAGTRAWWWAQHRELVGMGVAGWWLDGGEGPPDPSLHNRYDLLRYQAFAEGEAADRPDERSFTLCRSGGPGMQRFGAGCWTGDINNTFATLEAQIAIGLNVGLSGVPYWGTDIGGYYPTAPKSGELFARWFQFSAFCPLFRAHGRVWRDHLPWAHGAEIAAICRRYLELRYRLMPYTYTLAWHAHRLGWPLMRPIVFDHPDDPKAWTLGSQYLWGDDLLVAPVTREGATHWPVYLPRGRWYDFWTQQAHDGPAGITTDAPLDRLPLFVRAGAILPLAPVRQHLDGPPEPELTLLVYPSGRSSFTLYEDDGISNAYRRGACALTEFQCVAEDKTVTCRVLAPAGDARLVPHDRRYVFQIHAPAPPSRVVLENGGETQWRHDGAFVFVRLAGHPAGVKIEW